MKLHQSTPADRNAFTGYGESYVMVNATRYESSVVVLPDGPVRTWPVSTLKALNQAHLAELAALEVELVLLGTGRRLVFPSPALLAPFAMARIGVEVMDTPAACRTYNILMGEGRKVAAALIVERAETSGDR